MRPGPGGVGVRWIMAWICFMPMSTPTSRPPPVGPALPPVEPARPGEPPVESSASGAEAPLGFAEEQAARRKRTATSRTAIILLGHLAGGSALGQAGGYALAGRVDGDGVQI